MTEELEKTHPNEAVNVGIVKASRIGIVKIYDELDVQDYENIGEQITALHKAGASKILLKINSEGGNFRGLDAVLTAIKNCPVPIESLITGTCASSAYWIASQTSRIVARRNSLTGAIGVASRMTSTRRYMQSLGIEEWFAYSGGSPKKYPQTKEEFLKYEQPLVDEIFSNFVREVSEGRKVSVEAVLKTFGEGSVLTSQQALEVGMIDAIFNDVEDRLYEPTQAKSKTLIGATSNNLIGLENIETVPAMVGTSIMANTIPARWSTKSEVGFTGKTTQHQHIAPSFYSDYKRKVQARNAKPNHRIF